MAKSKLSTHELASAMEELVAALRALPDLSLDDLARLRSIDRRVNHNLPLQDELFHELSESSKTDLIDLIEEVEIPVSYTSKDSAESLARKIRRAIAEDPRLERRVIKATVQSSPSLSRALRTLRGFSGK